MSVARGPGCERFKVHGVQVERCIRANQTGRVNLARAWLAQLQRVQYHFVCCFQLLFFFALNSEEGIIILKHYVCVPPQLAMSEAPPYDTKCRYKYMLMQSSRDKK